MLLTILWTRYIESWPNTTSVWASWSRIDIPVDRYDGVHSLLICTRGTLWSPTCHQARQQENTYGAKYQKADRASTLFTLWLGQHWFFTEYTAASIQGLHPVYRGARVQGDVAN